MDRISSSCVEHRGWSRAAARLVAMIRGCIPVFIPMVIPVFVIPVFFVCTLVASDAFGCPNCKDAVNTSDPEGMNMARGYFYSILIMLAMPCTLISSFGIYVWREMQRQKRAGLSSTDQAVASFQGRLSSEPITPPHA